MSGPHEIWHVAVLAASLLGGAAVAVVVLAPLVFEPPPEGLARARPYLLGLGGVAAVLLAAEWLGVH
ncbi:MAG TPA: hypothetical protein VHN37_04355 [Actinomycetota bacterium]|nr:hypothetical protein [Actinomycetota bacterium]